MDTQLVSVARVIELAPDLATEREPFLFSRHDGAVFLPRLRSYLLEFNTDTAVEVSFDQIRLMDTSFADEVFGTLAAERSRREFRAVPFFLSHLNPTSLDNLRFALIGRAKLDDKVNRHCVLPYMDTQGNLQLVGEKEPKLADTFELLRLAKSLTGPQVASIWKLSDNNASSRLKALYDLGLATRTELRDEQGRQFIYRWLV